MVVARTQAGLRRPRGAARRPRRSTAATAPWCGASPSARSGVIDAPIGRSHRDPTRMAVSAAGQGGPHPLRRRAHLRPTRRRARCSSAASRPVAPTRSACTWRPSATPWSATTATGACKPSIRRRAPVPARRPRSRSTTRPARRAPVVRVAAPARPGGRARRAQREPAHGGVTTGAASSPGQVASPRAIVDDVGEGDGLEEAAHVLADVGPDREQHALALVVAGAVGVGLAEVAGHDRAVDGADDLGEADLLRVAGQDVAAADAPLRAHQTGALEGEEDLLEVRLGEARALGDVADRRGPAPSSRWSASESSARLA